jgi:hypothetical protein
VEERERHTQQDVARPLHQREKAKQQPNAMKDKTKAWVDDNRRVKNIRTLLSTMHMVVWDDSKCTEVNMDKLIQTNDIKKQYRKAMIAVLGPQH